ncbi:MAG: hypothetical protein JXB30_12125 [Anaerolineae bacterium]|nr:hypothetical protein [Anaerolineae bacterium]
MEQLKRTTTYRQLKRLVYGLGKFYSGGPRNLSEGIDACRALHDCGIPSTLGKFNEVGDDPEQIVRECQMASDVFRNAAKGDLFYLSLKPPAFDFNIELITPIVATALANGQGVHFDAHEHVLADPTIQLLEQVIDRFALPDNGSESWKFSLVLPTRWKRSIEDAEWVIKKGVRARLVKGEFKSLDPSEEMNPGKGFLTLVDRLVGHVPEIAVATHDYVLAREAITRCKDVGCLLQLELLFGMPVGNMMALAREMKVPVRFYVPYGENLLIYGMRHFLANPYKLLRPGLLEVFASHEDKLAKIAKSL